MAQRRFGPLRGAGVAIIEEQAAGTIEPGALGTTAYTTVLQKGPVGKAFLALNETQFKFKAGNRIPESLGPDAAFDFFDQGAAAGSLWLSRVTDGNEKAAELIQKNRLDVRGDSIKWLAGNGGRWAGKKQKHVDSYAAITPTTITFTNIPAGLKKDELAGGKLTLSAVPGKSFEILSNTALGVITVPSDIDLVVEIDGSANLLFSAELLNDGLALAVLIKEGLDQPADEWGLEVYLVEGGIAVKVKDLDNLSSDPNSLKYFLNTINDDPNADFLLKAEDLFVGSVSAAIRPANVFSKSLTLTSTVLTAKIHDEVVSSVAAATAKAAPLTLGASVILDRVTLTVSTAGARAAGLATFPGQPADADTVVINGKTITFKTVVADATAEVLIGGSAEATLDNLVAFINASQDVLLLDLLFAEKASASTMDLFAQTAGLAGNAFTTTSAGGGGQPTWGGATLAGGLDQIWDYVSEKMPFLTGLTVTSGVAFAAPNEFGVGFTIIDTSKDSTKVFAVADTIILRVCPLEVGKLVDGILIPNVIERRKRFRIVSNTAGSITVAAGSDMTVDAALGDNFRVEYIQELSAGFDGLSEIADQDFIDAYNTGTSALKGLRNRNLGLVKLASPGNTVAAVQKAGVAFAASQNWQYRYEVPSNIVDEQAVDEFISETLGKNDFGVVHFPSFAFVVNTEGPGNKLISLTGAIHGKEARVANDFDGFHKAAAGVDVILSNIVKLPDGLEGKELDEEFLNPAGINIIKRKEGNFIMWGDRTVGLDTAFKFKHQRETMSHFENIFLENFDFIIFALNDDEAQQSLISAFRAFFIPEFAKGAIRGKDVDDAARIKIDDENNTDATRAAGDLNAEIQLRLADTVERFIIRISKLGVTEET